jgi:hypothetical protein
MGHPVSWYFAIFQAGWVIVKLHFSKRKYVEKKTAEG